MRHIIFIPTGEDQRMGKISSKQQKLEGEKWPMSPFKPQKLQQQDFYVASQLPTMTYS